MTFAEASRDFRFAAAVAGFGMVLRDSAHKGNFSFEKAVQIGSQNLGNDPYGDRREMINLIKKMVW